MKKPVVFAATLLAALATGAAASGANKGLNGVWQINFFAGPNGSPKTTLCIEFFQTNNIVGYTKYSGTWVSTSSTDLAGQWIQNGDDVMWYGTSGKVSFFSVGDLVSRKAIGGSGYAQFKNTSNATQAAGNWSGRKKSNCVPSDE